MTYLLISLFLILASSDGTVPKIPLQWRQHFRSDAGKNPRYEITEIHDISETGDSQRYLVTDPVGERFVLTRRSDVDGKVWTHEISDLRGKRFVRFSFPMRTSATNLSGLLEEAKVSFDAASWSEAMITIETPEVARGGTEAQWKDRTISRAWVSEILTTLDPVFLETLESMREDLLSAREASTFKMLLDLILYRTSCDEQPDRRWIGSPPDCEFDKSFGYPCTDSQRQFIAERAHEGRAVDTYR